MTESAALGEVARQRTAPHDGSGENHTTISAWEHPTMLNLLEIGQAILSSGRVDGPGLEALRRDVYAARTIERRQADFLVELHKRVQHRTPAFEKFFYQAIKDHLLASGRVDAGDTAWLRQWLFADGKLNDEERRFLHELRGESIQIGPEFDEWFKECMKHPPEQRTCG